MATRTAPASTEAPTALANFKVETTTEIPRRTRGRSYDPFVIELRDQLAASENDGKARSLSPVEPGEQRTELGNKVRAAGKALHGPEFKVKTMYDERTKTLFFGPSEVINKLQNPPATAEPS